MFDFIHSLLGGTPGAIVRGREPAALHAAVERVVDGVDPRLRAVYQYRRILRRPVERTLDYLTESIEALPAAIAFDRSHFGADPRLRALFVGPDHLLEILSYSQAVRGYLSHSLDTPPRELYVAIRMDRTERTGFGMALDGDRVVRDVPQTTVSFGNYRVAFPAASEKETRSLVQLRAFDYLIELIRNRLAGMRTRRQQLEQQERLLLQGPERASGNDPLGRGGWGRATTNRIADGRKLREIQSDLASLRDQSGTLADQLSVVAEMLREPRRHLRLDRVSMTLDLMNVKVSDQESHSADTLIFSELCVGPDRRITLELIRFPCNQLLEPLDFPVDFQRMRMRPS